MGVKMCKQKSEQNDTSPRNFELVNSEPTSPEVRARPEPSGTSTSQQSTSIYVRFDDEIDVIQAVRSAEGLGLLPEGSEKVVSSSSPKLLDAAKHTKLSLSHVLLGLFSSYTTSLNWVDTARFSSYLLLSKISTFFGLDPPNRDAFFSSDEKCLLPFCEGSCYKDAMDALVQDGYLAVNDGVYSMRNDDKRVEVMHRIFKLERKGRDLGTVPLKLLDEAECFQEVETLLFFKGRADCLVGIASFFSPRTHEGLKGGTELVDACLVLRCAIVHIETQISDVQAAKLQKTNTDKQEDEGEKSLWSFLSFLRKQLLALVSSPSVLFASGRVNVTQKLSYLISNLSSTPSTFSIYTHFCHALNLSPHTAYIEGLQQLRELWFTTGRLGEARKIYNHEVKRMLNDKELTWGEVAEIFNLISDFFSFMHPSADTIRSLKMAYVATREHLLVEEINTYEWLKQQAEGFSLSEVAGDIANIEVKKSTHEQKHQVAIEFLDTVGRLAVKSEDLGNTDEAKLFYAAAISAADRYVQDGASEKEKRGYLLRKSIFLLLLGRIETLSDPNKARATLMQCIQTQNAAEGTMVPEGVDGLIEHAKNRPANGFKDKGILPVCAVSAASILSLEVSFSVEESEEGTEKRSILSKLVGDIIKGLPEGALVPIIEYLRILSRMAVSLGRLPDCLHRAEQALEAAKTIFEESSLDYAAVEQTLSVGYFTIGQFDKAWEVVKHSHRVYTKHFPRSHPELLSSFERIGNSLYETGMYKQAVSPLEEAYKACVSLFGAGDPHTDSPLFLLAAGRRSAGDVEGSRRDLLLLFRSRTKRAVKKETDDRYFSVLCSKIGETTLLLGDHSSAMAWYLLSLRIVLADLRLGPLPTLPDDTNGTNIVVPVMNWTKDLDELMSKAGETTDDDVATTLSSLGVCLKAAGNYSASVDTFKTALIVERKIYGGKHPEVAKTLFHLAEALMHENEVESATQTAELAYDIFAETLGEGSPFTRSVLPLIEQLEAQTQSLRQSLSE
uniref:Uncharacterized protein n=2 Tax=Palpitomonas bilix TaxID=652834 RepID=A0A7S3D2D0_9EUKA|mmetsp:Transcript_18881/g.48003  ORF Transcript_18881/g.48003 Transcript_18881/m.48003 type:complete len:1011 (+) Transcript_18881:101-3133(+)